MAQPCKGERSTAANFNFLLANYLDSLFLYLFPLSESLGIVLLPLAMLARLCQGIVIPDNQVRFRAVRFRESNRACMSC
jgi:hypothetical protein